MSTCIVRATQFSQISNKEANCDQLRGNASPISTVVFPLSPRYVVEGAFIRCNRTFYDIRRESQLISTPYDRSRLTDAFH